MGFRGAATLGLVFLGCVVCSVVCTVEDGTPRPGNFPDAPAASYGPLPTVTSSAGVAVDCQWYGWTNRLYNATTGAKCLDLLREAVTNATANPPGSLKPYQYYIVPRLVDPSNNQSVCLQGCYNLGNSYSLAPAPSPLGGASDGSNGSKVNGGSFFAPSALLSCFVAAVALILINLNAH